MRTSSQRKRAYRLGCLLLSYLCACSDSGRQEVALTNEQVLATVRADPKTIPTFQALTRLTPRPTEDPSRLATALAAPMILAFAEARPDKGPAPLAVRFSVSIQESNVESLTYRWDFGDGSPPSEEPRPKHVYDKPGKYQARVEISGGGTSEKDSLTIYVEAPARAGEG